MNRIRPIAVFAGAGFLAAFLTAVCLPAPAQTAPQQTRADAEKDPVLKAMLQELDRSKTQLQLKDFAKPFFIQYRIEDVDDFETKAEFGAGEGSEHKHQRVARITVRVGDYKTDSSSGRGDGSAQMEALDDDPIAIRSALWTATDQAYKSALAAYAQKQAELKQVQTPPQADDFSHESPLISLAAPLRLKLDEPAWTDRVARDSGLYRTDAAVKDSQREVRYSSGGFSARVTITWLVNTDGAIVRKSSGDYQEVYRGGRAGGGRHESRPLLCHCGRLAGGPRCSQSIREACVGSDSLAHRPAQCSASSKRSITARYFSVPTPAPIP